MKNFYIFSIRFFLALILCVNFAHSSETRKSEWISSIPITNNMSGRFEFSASERVHFLVKTGKVSNSFILTFQTEFKGQISNSIDLTGFNFSGEENKKKEAILFNLSLKPDHCAIFLSSEAKASSAVPINLNGLASWEIHYTPSQVIVSLNGSKIITAPNKAGDTVPFLRFRIPALINDSSVLIQNLSVQNRGENEDSISGEVESIEPDADSGINSVVILHREKSRNQIPHKRFLGLIPYIFKNIIALSGISPNNIDPVIFATEDMFLPGDNSEWIYTSNSALKAGYPESRKLGEDIVRWYLKKSGNPEAKWPDWLKSGFITFIGNRAIHKSAGEPDWMFHFAVPFLLPEGLIPAGKLDPPLELDLTDKKNAAKYGNEAAVQFINEKKAYLFLTVLSEFAGYGNVKSIFIDSFHKKLDGVFLLNRAEELCKEKIGWLKNGWLSEGKYLSGTIHIHSSIDSDGDGLADFQEIARGLDPNNPDTDKDGFSDYYELEMELDPKNIKNPPKGRDWTIDGVPGDFVRTNSLPFTIIPGKSKEISEKWDGLYFRIEKGSLNGVAVLSPFSRFDKLNDEYTISLSDGEHTSTITWYGRGRYFKSIRWEDGYEGRAIDSWSLHLHCSKSGCEYSLPIISLLGNSTEYRISYSRDREVLPFKIKFAYSGLSPDPDEFSLEHAQTALPEGEGNEAGKWRKILVRVKGEFIEGAAFLSEYGEDVYDIFTVRVSDGKNSYKVFAKNGFIEEIVPDKNYKGRLLKPDELIGFTSLKGIVFKVPIPNKNTSSSLSIEVTKEGLKNKVKKESGIKAGFFVNKPLD